MIYLNTSVQRDIHRYFDLTKMGGMPRNNYGRVMIDDICGS